jgi:deazaflavin-dependent oxidoreductase (nitroreductase family)
VASVEQLGHESFCYLTTRGRVSGDPHEIEIWFAARDSTIYMLAGGGDSSDWVKNLRAEPAVTVRIATEHFDGVARIVDDQDDDAWARSALFAKYNGGYGGDLTEWSKRSLPVAVDLTTRPAR